jgi:Rrf2 family protein
MALGEGIEWAAHACAVLAALPQGRALSVASLAEFHEVPRAYLAKHMQALARAGIVRSSRGPNGGYSLARPAAEVSMWDIRVALEGAEPDFRCQEIRRRGPCPSRKGDAAPCTIAAAFWEAERLYREQLSRVSVADIVRAVASHTEPDRAKAFFAWLAQAR